MGTSMTVANEPRLDTIGEGEAGQEGVTEMVSREESKTEIQESSSE